MSEETPQDAVRQFFKNPEVATRVINMVVSNKPAGWSPRSTAPYYKEEHALILKEAADNMLATRDDCTYFYTDFPRMSAHTVYLMVNQSLRFLLDKLDDEAHTYSKWAAMVNITRERNVGVLISFDEHHRHANTDYVKPKPVKSKDKAPIWREELDSYLDDDRMTKPLHIDGLCLTPDEIKVLRDSLLQVEGIIHEVTSQFIKIIKIN